MGSFPWFRFVAREAVFATIQVSRESSGDPEMSYPFLVFFFREMNFISLKKIQEKGTLTRSGGPGVAHKETHPFGNTYGLRPIPSRSVFSNVDHIPQPAVY